MPPTIETAKLIHGKYFSTEPLKSLINIKYYTFSLGIFSIPMGSEKKNQTVVNNLEKTIPSLDSVDSYVRPNRCDDLFICQVTKIFKNNDDSKVS